MPSTMALAQIAQDQFPCWARSATGAVLALIAAAAYVGGRVAVRQYRDGRVTAANVTGALVVVGVLAALTAFWFVLESVF